MHKSKKVALLGVFTALIAVLRPLGLGAVGVEPMWFALILISRAMGIPFSLALGALSMSLSAVLTAGIGPWLPGQIISATLIAAGTSIIPKSLRGRNEILLLMLYGILAAEFYGIVMDLFYWPLALGSGTQLSFDSALSLSENVGRFFTYHFVGALAWDIPRAVVTASLIGITGSWVLKAIRRSVERTVIIERVKEPAATE